ncbi:substrate-binding domain-containing protein [Arthrobacter methylotrophus]
MGNLDMNLKSFQAVGAICVTALAFGLISTATATAEPTTSNRPLAAVGSDTIQDVWNALSNTGPIKSVASYNAFGDAATIVTKTGVAPITRPNGSGAGVKALSASLNPLNHVYKDSANNSFTLKKNDVDIARSSSSPSVTGTDLTFLPFARDAVTVAVKDAANRPLSLTTQQVANIFSCTAGDGVTIDGATGKPVLGTMTFTPKLPQAASGTRAFFLKAIGVTPNTTCISDAEQVYPENNGEALVNDGDIFPFSAAQWIAQKNGAMTDTTTAGQLLADIDGLKAIDQNTAAPALAPGDLYGDPAVAPASGKGIFARDTYNVVSSGVQTSKLTYNVVLNNAVSTSLKTTAGKSIITKFGFKTLSYVGDWTMGKKSGYTN